jgi:hypothetical protein
VRHKIQDRMEVMRMNAVGVKDILDKEILRRLYPFILLRQMFQQNMNQIDCLQEKYGTHFLSLAYIQIQSNRDDQPL